MKKLNYLLVLALVAIIGFTSCSKDGDINEENQEIIKEDPKEGSSNPLTRNLEQNEDGGLDLECFTIDFPFALSVNGDEVVIEEIDDFTNALEGLTETDLVDFVYPLNITYSDGETSVANSAEELGEAWATCIPDDGWGGFEGVPAYLINDENACFDLIYPVDLTDGENTYTANNEDEFIQLLMDNDFLFFTFPFSVSTEEGEVVVVENEEGLFELLFSCEDNHVPCDSIFGFEGDFLFGCYEVGYPLTLSTIDGEEVVVNNEDELIPLLIDGSVTGFVYPLTLIDEDENEIVVNSEEEFITALGECDGFFGPEDTGGLALVFGSQGAGGDCYSINYPITLGGAVVSSFEEALSSFENGNVELEYPVSVTLLDSNEVIDINNMDDINALYETCEF